jgi:DNA polymerase epsilon subunit 1
MGHRRLYLQLCFRNASDLLTVRCDIVPLALANSAKRDVVDAYAEVVSATAGASMDIELDGDFGVASSSSATRGNQDPRERIIDIREYGVLYYLRVAIDNDIRVGLWYAVTFTAEQPSFKNIPERVKRADPVVMAYDIETTKAPLKFPDQAIDQVMMISYMVRVRCSHDVLPLHEIRTSLHLPAIISLTRSYGRAAGRCVRLCLWYAKRQTRSSFFGADSDGVSVA